MKIYLMLCNKIRGRHFLEPSTGYYRAHVCKQTLKFKYETPWVFLVEIFLAGGGARVRVGVRRRLPIAALPAQRRARARVHASHTRFPTHLRTKCLLKCQIILWHNERISFFLFDNK